MLQLLLKYTNKKLRDKSSLLNILNTTRKQSTKFRKNQFRNHALQMQI